MVSMMSLATPTSEAGRAMVGACVYKQGQKSYNTTQPKHIFSIELGPQHLFDSSGFTKRRYKGTELWVRLDNRKQ